MFLGIFLVPMALTIMFNMVMFFLGVRVLIKSSRQKHIQGNDRKNARNTIKLIVGICGLMTLFGVGWIFGVLTFNETAAKVFEYVFVIFNVFQGFYFFILICLIGKDGREFWIGLFRFKSLKKLHFGSSFTGGPQSQLFRSVQVESNLASNKTSASALSSSTSCAGLVFSSPHQTALELVPGNLNMNDKESDNQLANSIVKTDSMKHCYQDEDKLAMILEEEAKVEIRKDNFEVTNVSSET